MTEHLTKYIRAADYLSAAQIYLQKNALLREPLEPDHIKNRLLGHWGTCPGINFVYAHLNRLLIERDLNVLFVLGPGHGFPAIQANLFLEGTLSKYNEHVTRDAAGIEYMSRMFSWPYGFPSHSNPEAPGVILEGGELGYSLATAYGSVLDNPDLIAACLVGDGEAETGPIATAWHLNKIVDPATNGAVLPILHVNGYKISGPTFFGRMSDKELIDLFSGYGYEPHIVDSEAGDDVHETMMQTLNECLESIHFTQHLARVGELHGTPRFPMIVLRTPKGWNSIKELNGEKVEGNHASHQVIAADAKKSEASFEALESWLHSYRFDELFDGISFDQDIEALVPDPEHAMGNNRRTMGGKAVYKELSLPRPADYSCSGHKPGEAELSSMETIGGFIRDVVRGNEADRNFRLMSPDETYSNKLHAVFEATTRSFVWPLREWDKDIARDGRVMEMLSEHSLQGLLQGYILTGRHGMLASYEAFVQIIASMVDQYAKFLSIAREVSWRGDIASLNYILTSSGWRQEHNGFSHQNPGFIDDVLQRQGCFTNVYFPADANTALVVTEQMLASKNEINVLVCGKRPMPCWRSHEEAKQDLMDGLSIWEFASDENPDVVFAAIGDYLTKETLAAIDLVKQEAPEISLRFVNITSLSALGIGHTACRVLRHDLNHYFTEDKSVIINFHGYPQTIKQILFDYGCTASRFSVHGYEENGSTTTPFDMQVRNNTDRYHLAIEAFDRAHEAGVLGKEKHQDLVTKYTQKLEDHKRYIVEYGEDPAEIEDWKWQQSSS